jgi:predicted ABC-type transport system involved in lysophospholipase L1 biosynthesis ATPase subunit
VWFDGIELSALEGKALKAMRRRMQMIFQDPFASLNPRMTVSDTLAEPLLLHGLEDKRSVAGAVLKLMDDVGLPRAAVRKYPHEFSGGQRQSILISTIPSWVVADKDEGGGAKVVAPLLPVDDPVELVGLTHKAPDEPSPPDRAPQPGPRGAATGQA